MSGGWDQSHDTDTRLDRRTVLKTISGAAIAAVGSAPTVSAAAGSYTEEDYNGRRYTKYVPEYNGSEAMPLLLMLHGCTQTPDEFKDATQMNQVAEENTFIVLYPEQTTGVFDCWQWFNDSNTTRNNGELETMVGIVNQEKDQENIDDQRVYIAGFSAGGAFVPNAITEYADVFAAGGVHSGTMYDVAESQTEGNRVIIDCSAGSSTDPAVEGRHAYDRMEQFGITRPVPTIVFHGTNDTTVYPCNGHEAAEQATVTNDLALDGSDNGSVDYTADVTNTGSGSSLSYTEYEYHDAQGRAVVEKYIVDGMGHAWSGGASGGSYTAPGGPDASRLIWDFFTNWTVNGTSDTGPTANASAHPTSAHTDDTIDFDGSGSGGTDGTISSYEWDFGDGSSATGAHVSHSYSSTGDYTVTLSVSTNAGASDTDTVTVSIGGYGEYCGTSDNHTHVQQGRAYAPGDGYAYAVGSDEQMGLNNTYYTTTLKETAKDHYEIVTSC